MKTYCWETRGGLREGKTLTRGGLWEASTGYQGRSERSCKTVNMPTFLCGCHACVITRGKGGGGEGLKRG